MGSSRQKRKFLLAKRREKRSEEERAAKEEAFATGVGNGSILPADASKIRSRSVLPPIPDYYYDKPFECADCGAHQVWTAKQQKRWYEEQGGEIESTAIRCRDCRKKERERKSRAREVHREGLAKQGKSPTKPIRSRWLPPWGR
ncbi:MAG: zinc-ribbon domain-containing protein [Verrucomicrobiales bacterium]